MITFPHIDGFKNLEKQVKRNHDFQGVDLNGEAIINHISPYPTIEFVGIPKLHGTNAAFVRYAGNRDTVYQSRNRELTLMDDNAGFVAQYGNTNLDYLFNKSYDRYMAIFGEYCGGNIQKGVAICKLPKMFVIFAVIVDDKWIEVEYEDNDALRIYTLSRYQKQIRVDFNEPDLSEVDRLTNMTEEECPFAKQKFNIDGHGEGWVWVSRDRQYSFKSKNEKHKVESSLPKEIKVASEKDIIFSKSACNKNRLENVLVKMLDMLSDNEPHINMTGMFIGLMTEDILREEKATICDLQLDVKTVKQNITKIAKEWFMSKL